MKLAHTVSRAYSTQSQAMVGRTQVVRRNDYAVLELGGNDRCSCHDRALGVLDRAGRLEV